MATVEELVARKEQLALEVESLRQSFKQLDDELAEIDEEVEEDVEEVNQELSHHQYFDDLIQSLMSEGIRQVEDAKRESNKAKRQKRESAKDRSAADYTELHSKLEPAIQLENAYRLGGITGFPVNDPQANGTDRYLGIRFDVFDQDSATYVVPHYVILRRQPKNDQWEIFKTTVPNFIPLHSIAYEYLNVDLIKFAKRVRQYLIQFQLKKATFLRLKARLQPPSGLDHDLDFSKISITLNDTDEVVLICDLFRVSKVHATSVGPQPSAELRQLEILLADSKIYNFDQKFLAAAKNIYPSVYT
ncbi:hypothetical protein OGAPHI_004375 [Ogataea philodendri]|uniref:Central kinetochore subunit MCM21 n=1 Tax=Ogataea philodendri TaxID=1378263 RepID=A0A9P8T5Q8_9ASCO|nr:uncharacterized protein OGAPHI_004375 [Ogataea philodendri]KAH3666186.1 hypothetical protein OGAPHI_004375 [Ogataea philodendri]